MNAEMKTRRGGGLRSLSVKILMHSCLVATFLVFWEWSARANWIDPSFTGQPSGIARYLWENMVLSPKIWIEMLWTIYGTLASFVLGGICAIVLGMLFVAMPKFEKFSEPYVAALNATPRIALMPLFILWFGLGVSSKIAIGFSLTFFIVLSNTVAGIRGVDQDHLTLSSTLGAKPLQVFFLVTIPGAIPVIFSGLRLGLLYALLGVVAGEIIAAKHGLGQTVAYLSSTFNMDGVMAVVLVLATLGMTIVWLLGVLEKRLLHWQ